MDSTLDSLRILFWILSLKTMDLPATFQSSFQQMIIKVKQDVVIDIHRRIDHQASAIYQLFLAEYQRKSPSLSSSGTALGNTRSFLIYFRPNKLLFS